MGSSSIKLAVVSIDESFEITPLATVSTSGGDHQQTIESLIDELNTKIDTSTLSAVGYRVVYGGQGQSGPQDIDDSFIQRLQADNKLDPEHTVPFLKALEVVMTRFPDVRHVACYDTTFYNDLPRIAQLLPIPRQYQSDGLRRYGFHGLSYEYLLSAVKHEFGDVVAHGRIIFAHLGSGASLTATKDMKPIDTTMGLTPASGVVMSTRSGDVDTGLVWYLHKKYDMTIEQYNHMVNYESGLLGVSGSSADMHTLIDEASIRPESAEAVELFCYDVKKAIGALSASLGGVDSLVFSGGIGEQSSVLRKRICDGLEYLGIQIDDEKNDRHELTISVDGSGTGVHVFSTNESNVIARIAYQHIHQEETI
ncbi:MAG: acetate/propionate family kinase [Candidatus Saccharimonadales bacterium]